MRRMATVVHGFNVEALVEGCKKALAEITRDPENYRSYGNDEVFEYFLETISPGSAGVYQPEEIKSYFDLEGEDFGEDDEWFWDELDNYLYPISRALSDELAKAGTPGAVNFGHLEADGSYGIFYVVLEDEIEGWGDDIAPIPARRDAALRRLRARRAAEERCEEGDDDCKKKKKPAKSPTTGFEPGSPADYYIQQELQRNDDYNAGRHKYSSMLRRSYQPTYWNNNGKHQDLYDRLFKELVPPTGRAFSVEGELLRAISRIYYDLYNNGFGNGPFTEQWETISANWSQLLSLSKNQKGLEAFRNAFKATNYGQRFVENDGTISTGYDDDYDSSFPYRYPEVPEVGDITFTDEAYRGLDSLVDAIVLLVDRSVKSVRGAAMDEDVEEMEESEEDEGEEEEMEEEDNSPSQEDINDGIVVYQKGDFWIAEYGFGSRRDVIVETKSHRMLWFKLQQWAKANNFWPDIYSVNDHGNVTAYNYRGKVIGEWV